MNSGPTLLGPFELHMKGSLKTGDLTTGISDLQIVLFLMN